jgi:hypothetical protein
MSIWKAAVVTAPDRVRWLLVGQICSGNGTDCIGICDRYISFVGPTGVDLSYRDLIPVHNMKQTIHDTRLQMAGCYSVWLGIAEV